MSKRPHFQPLTRAEERNLFKRIAQKRGDTDALKKQLILSNQGLVLLLANKYARSGSQLIDLIQAGNTTLLKALDRYDYRKGYRFTTYAVWFIRKAMA